MRALLAILSLAGLALAGCGSPQAGPAPAPATLAPSPAPDLDYDLTVRVSQETADGPAMPGVEVQAFVLGDDGAPGPAIPRSTDTQGFARFTFEDPVRVAVRATAPGWTREGVVLQVRPDLTRFDSASAGTDPAVAAVVSERDLFLPLFHAELRLSAATSLMTGTVRPAADGSLDSPVATADLALPAGLEAKYLARMASADLKVAWEDTASSRAHLAAALAWDGAVWVQGEAPSPGLLPGPREATFFGPLPAERPDLSSARLQAAALLESAAVGDVPVSFELRLLMDGIEPPGLPVACHSVAGCLVPALPPPPAASGAA